MEKLVEIRDRQAMTDSLKVAEYYGLYHKHVIENIRKCIKALESVGVSWTTSRQIDLNRYFVEGSYIDKRGKKYIMFHITRDGFMVLNMRLRTEKAYEKQLEFIEEFNKLEKENEVLSIENELLRRGSGCKQAYELGVFTRKETYEAALKRTINDKLLAVIDNELCGYIFALNDNKRVLKKHRELAVVIQGEPYFTEEGIHWIATNLPVIRRRNLVIFNVKKLLANYQIYDGANQNKIIKQNKQIFELEEILEPLHRTVQEKVLALAIEKLHVKYTTYEDALNNIIGEVQLIRAGLHE